MLCLASEKESDLSRVVENPWFAGNLTRLMEQRGLNNARLSSHLGVTRQAVQRWVRQKGNPTEENLAALCVALRCALDDLLIKSRQPETKMLPLTAWAKREDIPLTRARDLFALRLLSGEQHTPFTILVPEALRAPEDSKKMVLMAKRRPGWVPIFQENFPRLMSESAITCSQISVEIGVGSAAVMHWMHKRNYPHRDRLPQIAIALGVTVQELAGNI
jgi:transcriptional regulator with XRE-family HTH domain